MDLGKKVVLLSSSDWADISYLTVYVENKLKRFYIKKSGEKILVRSGVVKVPGGWVTEFIEIGLDLDEELMKYKNWANKNNIHCEENLYVEKYKYRSKYKYNGGAV